MTLSPIMAASPIVQIHVAAAILALIFTMVQLVRIKAGDLHRLFGWGFVITMAVTALSSFWITGLNHGRFSLIHLLSIVTLVSLPIAVIARRQGNIRRHKWNMIGLVAGLVGAGIFTLLPGRILHKVVFGI
jgi:uncharacterized membrane protein